MRIHTPVPRPREDGEFGVRSNPGGGDPFVIIALSEDYTTEIALDSLDDCDRLIRAAAEARRKLEAVIKGEPHPFEGDAASSSCGYCGLIRGNAIHAETAPARAS